MRRQWFQGLPLEHAKDVIDLTQQGYDEDQMMMNLHQAKDHVLFGIDKNHPAVTSHP